MGEDLVAVAVAFALTLLVVMLVIVFTIKSLIVIVPPKAVAVLTGRDYRLPSGETMGYRAMIGGRTLRVPFVERVQYMSLERFPLQLSLGGSEKGEDRPFNLQVSAEVRIASEPSSLLDNAVASLLGRTPEEVAAIAGATLEGVLRRFVAPLPPEDVKGGFSDSATALREQAVNALAGQGLRLEGLQVERVHRELG